MDLGSAGSGAIGYVSSLSIDVLLVLGLLSVLLILGFTKGKDALLAMILALYVGVVLATFFPFYGSLGARAVSHSAAFIQLAVFVSMAVAAYLILKGYIRSVFPQSGFWRVTEIVVLSVGATGLVLASLYHVAGIENLYNMSGTMDLLFASKPALFGWLVGPLVSLPLLVRA